MHTIDFNKLDEHINTLGEPQWIKYLDLMNKLFIDVNPIPIKEAMNRVFSAGWRAGELYANQMHSISRRENENK